MLAFTADSHKHKLKQLVDDDSTPNMNKNTMYLKVIMFLRRVSYLFGGGNYLKDVFEELIGNGWAK